MELRQPDGAAVIRDMLDEIHSIADEVHDRCTLPDPWLWGLGCRPVDITRRMQEPRDANLIEDLERHVELR
jgi:hypothetical protein